MRPCMQGVVAQVRCCRYSECRSRRLTPLHHVRSTAFPSLSSGKTVSPLSIISISGSALIIINRLHVLALKLVRLLGFAQGIYPCQHSEVRRPASFRFSVRNLWNVHIVASKGCSKATRWKFRSTSRLGNRSNTSFFYIRLGAIGPSFPAILLTFMITRYSDRLAHLLTLFCLYWWFASLFSFDQPPSFTPSSLHVLAAFVAHIPSLALELQYTHTHSTNPQ
jgi:hypothetical protein